MLIKYIWWIWVWLRSINYRIKNINPLEKMLREELQGLLGMLALIHIMEENRVGEMI